MRFKLIQMLFLSAFSTAAIHSTALADKMTDLEQKQFKIKQDYDAQMFQLKQLQEKALKQVSPKIDFELFHSDDKHRADRRSPSQECIQWVYRGASTREEAARACRGVISMDCVRWVYKGSATRVEAAKACRGRQSMECVQWVYRGSSTRTESAKACKDVSSMACVREVYRGSSTREESARACQDFYLEECD